MLVFLLVAALFPAAPPRSPPVRSVRHSALPALEIRLAVNQWSIAVWTWTAHLAPPSPQKPAQGLSGQSVTPSVSYPAGSVQQIIVDVFGPNAARAIRIATCESGLNPNARNKSGASGLFQIMLPLHAGMFAAHGWSSADWADPWKNSVVAYDLSRGGTDFSPWVCRG